MTSNARIERDDVLDELRPGAVLAHFGLKARRRGSEFRTRTCPACGERSREDAVAVNVDTGRWHCHAHGCGGDVLALVAGLAGLDVASQFREVLSLAAEIAGVQPRETLTAAERTQRRVEIERRTAEREAAELAEAERRRQQAIATATSHWGRLETHSWAGLEYLSDRCVAGVANLGLVRFGSFGAACVQLFTSDGDIVNVVRRRIDAAANPKVLGLKDCPTAGTFIDSVADIRHGRDVVLVEGVFDALTARLAWPEAVVLGAHGASNIPKVAAAAAPRVRLARSRLVLVPHADDAGVKAMTAAGRIARDAGLRLHKDLVVLVELGDANDLNDAWRAGWRPQA